MKKSILTTLSIILVLSVSAQKNGLKRGDRLLKAFKFQDAADAYKTVATKYPANIEAKEKLARAYVIAEDHADAEAAYADVLKLPGAAAINRLYYGQELRANGKYKEADAQFNLYAAAAPNDTRGKELSNGLTKVLDLAQDKKTYTVSNLPINSAVSDMGPAFYNGGIAYSSNKGKGAAVVRTDNWTGRNFYDIYVVSADANGNLTEAKRLKGKQPNRKYHEGPVAFSADGKEMFFTRSNYSKCKAGKSKDKLVKLKIFTATYDDAKKKWVNVIALPFNSSEFSVGHPSLSKDGKRLFFISDMPGGYGETDVYVSYRNGATWGPPINLGKNVNTAGRELFPFIAEDGTLYFSSDSKTGLGGLDVYSANFANGEWSDVQNVGAPINTNSDDFGYIIDGKNENGYFVSNRAGGLGDDDVYKFKKSGISVSGTVVDAQTKNAISGAEVKITAGDKVIATKKTDAKGAFSFNVVPSKDYKVSATNKDSDTTGVAVGATKENVVVQVLLSKIGGNGGLDLTVCVTDKGKGTAEGSTLTLTNKTTGEKKTCVINADCKCVFDLQAETDYELCATKESANASLVYDKPCKLITTKGKQAPATIQETFELNPLEEGVLIKLDNIYYDLNEANIRPEAEVELAKIVTLMDRFPAMQIELGSHTDCRATVDYNDQLSAKRAQACVNWLISKGINGSRLVAVGYGERRPTNNCACEGNAKSTCSEKEHQANRRTEFKVLKLK